MKKILTKNYFFLYILMCGGIILSILIELIKYPGIFQNYTTIPLFYLVLLFSFTNSIVVFKKNFISKELIKTLLILFIISSFLYSYFSFIESSFYPNYVLQKYKLNYHALSYLIFVIGAPLLVSIINKQFNRDHQLIFIQILKNPLIVIILSLLLISFITNTLNISNTNLNKRLSFMINKPFATNEQKRVEQISPEFYEFIRFVKNNTPENAKILIPPLTSPWYNYGNRYYLRYFLYPRTIISTEKANQNNFDYVLVIKGNNDPLLKDSGNNWPSYEIKASSLIILMSDRTTYKKKITTFKFNDHPEIKRFGLLIK